MFGDSFCFPVFWPPHHDDTENGEHGLDDPGLNRKRKERGKTFGAGRGGQQGKTVQNGERTQGGTHDETNFAQAPCPAFVLWQFKAVDEQEQALHQHEHVGA